MDTGESLSATRTIARGIELSPELKDGFRGTMAFAVLATAGRIVVPVAVQQTLDKGVNTPSGPDVGFTTLVAVLAAVAVVVTALASYQMTYRLFTSAERGLATLRIKAFRHVHDLPMLTQDTERRGALVSRVTSDVDQVSQFLIFGGIIAIVSVGQIIIATVLMAIYSWQLTIVVWVCFLPLFASLRFFQRRLSAAYGVVRQQVGVMLSKVSEPVVGAATVRSYAIEGRTQERIDTAIDRYKRASTRAQGLTAFSFSLGGVSAGLANAGVLIFGVLLGVDDQITAGEVLAFAFLVTLFVGPVQIGTQVLTDAQNAIAGLAPGDRHPGHPGGRRRPRRGRHPAARHPGHHRLRRRGVRLPERSARPGRHRPAHRAQHPAGGRRRDRARARPRSPSCSPGSWTRPRAPSASTAGTCVRCRSTRCASGW